MPPGMEVDARAPTLRTPFLGLFVGPFLPVHRNKGFPHSEEYPVRVEGAFGERPAKTKRSGPGVVALHFEGRRTARTAGSSGTSSGLPAFVDLRPSRMLYECRMKRRSLPMSSRRRARTSPRRAPVVMATRQATRARSSVHVAEKSALTSAGSRMPRTRRTPEKPRRPRVGSLGIISFVAAHRRAVVAAERSLLTVPAASPFAFKSRPRATR